MIDTKNVPQLFVQLADVSSRFEAAEVETAAVLLLAAYSIKNGRTVGEVKALVAEALRVVKGTL
jgi:hypothetical protein